MTIGLRVAAAILALGSSLAAAAQTKEAMAVDRPPEVKTPNFHGMSLDQANAANTTAAAAGGARPIFIKIVPQGAANGKVVSQYPAAGTPVPPGQETLNLTLQATAGVNWGQIGQIIGGALNQTAQTTVPPLQGDTQAVAAAALSSAKLQGRFTGDPSGMVIQQSPLAGTALRTGQEVSVTLAVPLVGVPSLTKLTLQAARQRLEAAHLTLGQITGSSGPDATNPIASQYPSPGSAVQAGSPVEVTLAQASMPPAVVMVYVPPLKGLTRTAALDRLEGVGLTLTSASGATTGIVTEQSPAASTRVPEGDVISITLAAKTKAGAANQPVKTTTGTAWQFPEPDTPTQLPPSSAPSIWIGVVAAALALAGAGGYQWLHRSPRPPINEAPPATPGHIITPPAALVTLSAHPNASHAKLTANVPPSLRFVLTLKNTKPAATCQFGREPLVRQRGVHDE